MTDKQKIAALEERVRHLEMRPVAYPVYVPYFVPQQPTFMPAQPWWVDPTWVGNIGAGALPTATMGTAHIGFASGQFCDITNN